MKRASKPQGRLYHLDVYDNFTVEQLSKIGAIAMAYNEAEAELDELMQATLNLTGGGFAVSDMVFTDAKGRVVKALWAATERFKKYSTKINDAYAHFMEAKGYRDAVIHATVQSPSQKIGFRTRNGTWFEVVLSEEALTGLYERIVLSRLELRHYAGLARGSNILAGLSGPQPISGTRRAQLEGSIQDHLRECRRIRERRKSLKPLPGFPKEPSDQDETPSR